MAELRERPSKIDHRLNVMHANRAPNRRYTLDEIAEFCGCSHQAIHYVERKAFRKLRRHLTPVLRELKRAMEAETESPNPDRTL